MLVPIENACSIPALHCDAHADAALETFYTAPVLSTHSSHSMAYVVNKINSYCQNSFSRQTLLILPAFYCFHSLHIVLDLLSFSPLVALLSPLVLKLQTYFSFIVLLFVHVYVHCISHATVCFLFVTRSLAILKRLSHAVIPPGRLGQIDLYCVDVP